MIHISDAISESARDSIERILSLWDLAMCMLAMPGEPWEGFWELLRDAIGEDSTGEHRTGGELQAGLCDSPP